MSYYQTFLVEGSLREFVGNYDNLSDVRADYPSVFFICCYSGKEIHITLKHRA